MISRQGGAVKKTNELFLLWIKKDESVGVDLVICAFRACGRARQNRVVIHQARSSRRTLSCVFHIFCHLVLVGSLIGITSLVVSDTPADIWPDHDRRPLPLPHPTCDQSPVSALGHYKIPEGICTLLVYHGCFICRLSPLLIPRTRHQTHHKSVVARADDRRHCHRNKVYHSPELVSSQRRH